MVQVDTDDTVFEVNLTEAKAEEGVHIIRFNIHADQPTVPKKFTLKWKMPCINVKGVWKTASLYQKRLQADWELESLCSRISVDAPVISLFGHQDENSQTFACSDAVNAIEMNAQVREEDNLIYCFVSFFTEAHQEITDYSAEIRIDNRKISFSQSIQDVGDWWAGMENLKPMHVPETARFPLYSTWYGYHQELSEEAIIAECKLAAGLGYKFIIIDDGWQTNDNNRGYDYTGDWLPERLNMPYLVDEIHKLGMLIGLWYSVPFIGKKSEAFQQFKGKFLTVEHRWAPVADPRYPEIREYLVSKYSKALTDWNLDAFKLDFIDDFNVYESTVLTAENGRDFANVNSAVDQLMGQVRDALTAIKPDIIIEFRQKYIGPAMRKFGNMFRAFDCPNDSATNRLRITDVKLLIGNTAVHSDPLTWHNDESVESASMMMLSGMFGVPQMSVILKDLPESHLKMIKFYTKYWSDNVSIFMDGHFVPTGPLANYPVLRASDDHNTIIAVYDDHVVDIKNYSRIDLLNAKMTTKVVCRLAHSLDPFHMIVYNCQGEQVQQGMIDLMQGLIELDVPAGGMVTMKKGPQKT